MSTWSIFWICFFSASVLKFILGRVLTKKMPSFTDSQLERLQKVTDSFARNLTINVEAPAKKRTKKTENQTQD